MKAFLLKSSVLTIVVFAIGAVLYSTDLKQFYLPVLPVFVGFFFVVTNLVYAYLLNIAVKPGGKFTAQYMAVSFLKMFFFLLVAIIYAALNREVAPSFLVNYLLMYIIYTFLEVSEYSKIVKQKGRD